MGSGGMGAVYRARSRGQEVALKVIHPSWAGHEEFRRRFRREVVISQLVTGPGVARLIDFDLDAATPWLATELIAGPTLADLITDTRPLQGRALLELAAGTVRGLIELHAQGVVHRDIKPANIIVAGRGPVLVDFGIAAAVELTTITNTGSLLGSAGWMSPEQVTGAQVGPATDVFSWAATMVYAATSNSPYGAGRPDAVAYRVRHEDPDLNGVPARLAPLLKAALAKDPAARPTAQQLAEALDLIIAEDASTWTGHTATLVELADEPTRADVRQAAHQPPAPQRGRARSMMLAAATVAGLLVAGTLWWQDRPAEGSAPATTTAGSQSAPKSQPAPAPTEPSPATEPPLPMLTATIDPRRPVSLAQLGTFLNDHVQQTVRLDLLWTPTPRGTFVARPATGSLSAVGAAPKATWTVGRASSWASRTSEKRST
jgi:serine/threonine protein kinase